MRLLLDLDDTIVELGSAWLEAYNRDYRDGLPIGCLTSWDAWPHVVIAECGQRIYDYLTLRGFYVNLRPLPGAIDGVRQLVNAGYDVVIVSDAPTSVAAMEKRIWCADHLAFIPRENIVLAARKEIIAGDVIFDDRPSTLQAYGRAFPRAYRAYIQWPWNRVDLNLCEGVHCVGSYHDTIGAWKNFITLVERVADGKEL